MAEKDGGQILMKVNICGLPHEVVEVEDKFNLDCHMGMIEYKDLIIKINKDMHPEEKTETLCHEMIHGILVHLGYTDMSNDEQLVQALGNAIYQGFEVKKVTDSDDLPAFEPLEHDGCKGCEYESFREGLEPCKRCKQSYIDKYTAKKVE